MLRLLGWLSLSLWIWPSNLALGQSASRSAAEELARPVPNAAAPAQAPSFSRPSLAGPVAETVVGGLVLITASFATGGFVAYSRFQICVSGTRCGPDTDHRMARRALGVGIPVALLGSVALVHGAYRIRTAKQRRWLALERVTLVFAADQASLHWGTAF